MNYYSLTKQEEKLLKDFEAGKLKPVESQKKVISKYTGYAKNALKKTKNINIRVTEQVYYKFKSLAVREGMPYQTLISSLLHKFSAGVV